MFHHDQLEIHQKEKEGITILELHGKLVMGAGEIELQDFAESLLQRGIIKLMLNCSAVTEIDSSAIGLLLLLSGEFVKAGGKLVLFNLSRAQGKVYEMARLEAVIEIYRDELDGVNSFFPDRAPPRYDILEYVESQTHEDQNDKN